MNGLLVLDKPAGPTSHDVVQRVRQLVGTRKVGHSGTLDPGATGVLLVGVGRATRLLGFLQNLPKTYRAVVKFGETTTTQDAEGEVVERRPCSFDSSDLERAALSMIGEIDQMPPMVSAVKVGGRSLYKAARRGEEVERAARRVTIYELTLEEFDPAGYRAHFLVRCSSGTYVRALADDLGGLLECGAHVERLRRIRVGSFGEEGAFSLDRLETDPGAALLSMREALKDFPAVTVRGKGLEDVRHGRPLPPDLVPRRSGELPVGAERRPGESPAHEAGMTAGVPVAVLSPEGDLLAVYRKSRGGGLRPAAVLMPGDSDPA